MTQVDPQAELARAPAVTDVTLAATLMQVIAGVRGRTYGLGLGRVGRVACVCWSLPEGRAKASRSTVCPLRFEFIRILARGSPHCCSGLPKTLILEQYSSTYSTLGEGGGWNMHTARRTPPSRHAGPLPALHARVVRVRAHAGGARA